MIHYYTADIINAWYDEYIDDFWEEIYNVEDNNNGRRYMNWVETIPTCD